MFLIHFFIRISEIINEIYDGNINVDDENVQSYVECMMKKFNIVSINNIIT